MPAGRITGPLSTGWWPLVVTRAPPPGYRKSPVTSGNAQMARIACPAPWCRCRPSPTRIAVGRVVAIRSPSRRTVPGGRPHSAAARSTGQSSSRAASSGQPVVCAASHASSAAPASRTWRISPSASAASVPGSGATCSSLRAAVSVRSGSMVTTYAPRSRACCTNGHRCRLVTSGLAPQSTIRLRLDDRLRLEADRGAVERAQRRPCRRRADGGVQPGRAQVGEEPGAHGPALDQAHGAGEVVGQHRLRAVEFDARAQSGGHPVDCLVPARRPVRDPAGALRAGADPGRGEPVRPVHRVQVAVHLAAERAPGERVVAVAAQRDRPAVGDGELPDAGVGAVQRAGAGVGGDGGHGADATTRPAGCACRFLTCRRVGGVWPGWGRVPAGADRCGRGARRRRGEGWDAVPPVRRGGGAAVRVAVRRGRDHLPGGVADPRRAGHRGRDGRPGGAVAGRRRRLSGAGRDRR